MESDMRYAVIKFPQDNTVDVVPSNWLETTNEGIYCYWPRKNFTAKVKRRDVPDPAMWSKHLASVLVYAENYEEARLKSNQATVTSNLESDEEPSRRPVRRPARYRRPLEDSDEEDMPAPKMSRTVNTSRFTPRREFFGERMSKKSIPETLPRNTFSEPCSSGLLIRQEPESDRELLFEADVSQDVPSSAGQTNLCSTELKKLERAMFVRLDKLEQKMSAIETLLRTVVQTSDTSCEFLVNPCQSSQELDDLCLKLQDNDFRKKTVHYLSLLGGKTPGDAIRRVLRTIGTNSLWSKYSMRGRKGEKKFGELNICSVIIQACQKIHPKVPAKVLEDCIADTLKYAPHRESRMEHEQQTD
nr:uncharacterized protein LOC129423983 isoform X2 [Misgurnus anguillicaudatus]